jgi:hypothetical protein
MRNVFIAPKCIVELVDIGVRYTVHIRRNHGDWQRLDRPDTDAFG